MEHLRFPDGKPKALTFSYDDGVRQDIRLINIFSTYRLFGTFNINSGMFGSKPGERCLTAQEIKDLYLPRGQELAVHSLTHPFLELLPPDRALYEIAEDRRNLEALSGTIVRGMAYPFGTYNNTVVQTLQAAGIAYARTTVSTGDFRLPCDWFRLSATCHHRDERLFSLAERFIDESPDNAPYHREPWLFYVWGHSYEFDNDNNWDRIERFSEKISGKADVWYATNMQIYDYISAYRTLQFSFDGSVVKNPSALSVWLEKDGETFVIPPNKTVTL